MKLAKEMDITDLRAKNDSQLVTNQVSGEFLAKDPQMVKYLERVRNLSYHFNSFELVYVPRDNRTFILECKSGFVIKIRKHKKTREQ
jgi:ribonuclease HI